MFKITIHNVRERFDFSSQVCAKGLEDEIEERPIVQEEFNETLLSTQFAVSRFRIRSRELRNLSSL